MDRSVPTFLGRASSRRFKETAPLSLPLLRPPARQIRPTKRRNDCPTNRPTERPSDQATDPPTDYPADRSSRHGPFSPQNPSFSYKEACTRAHAHTNRQNNQTDKTDRRTNYETRLSSRGGNGVPSPHPPDPSAPHQARANQAKKKEQKQKIDGEFPSSRGAGACCCAVRETSDFFPPC